MQPVKWIASLSELGVLLKAVSSKVRCASSFSVSKLILLAALPFNVASCISISAQFILNVCDLKLE